MDSLNVSQVEELKADLAALEVSIQALLDSTEIGTKPVKLKDNIGRLSRMDEMHNQSILVANRNVLMNRLKQIRIAKLRINDDAYGICIECDRAIAFPRLKAYPEAAMCIECKSQSESGD
jgi:DnaK suppressor protein